MDTHSLGPKLGALNPGVRPSNVKGQVLTYCTRKLPNPMPGLAPQDMTTESPQGLIQASTLRKVAPKGAHVCQEAPSTSSLQQHPHR